MNSAKLGKAMIVVTAFIGVLLAMPVTAQEESLVIDPNSGDYHIYYRSVYDGDLVEVVFVPATKIDPTVKSKFKINDRNNVLYRYKVRNGEKSKQSLVTLVLNATSVQNNSQVAPAGWDGSAVPDDGGAGYIVGWSYDDLASETAGLRPGRSQNGFGIESRDLPGIVSMRLNGNTPIQGFPDSGPDPESTVGKQFNELHSRDFVTRSAAAPRIPTGQPFDPTLTLAGIQKHLNQVLVSMKLVDPVFAAQLDLGLQAAIDAAKLNNTKALKEHLKDLRHALKKEHHDVDKEDDDKDDEDSKPKKSGLIDKLAARVLDFDIKYIEKRISGRNED